MTFSIVGYDPGTGDLGIVVSTARLAVGSRVPWLEAGVGAVATQSVTNASFGPMILRLLREGTAPDAALAEAVATDPGRAQRQVAVIDVRGRTAAWTGEECKDWRGQRFADHVVAAGNILVGEGVLTESLRAYGAAGGELRDRLLAAYRAGQDAGGDRGGVQSAALRVERINVFPYIDLRVDDHPSPVDELERLAGLIEAIAPRLPRLRLTTPTTVVAACPFDLLVEDDAGPVAGIALTVDGRSLGMTDGEGHLRATLAAPGDHYLAAAEPATPNRAPIGYRYVPAVAWISAAG